MSVNPLTFLEMFSSHIVMDQLFRSICLYAKCKNRGLQRLIYNFELTLILLSPLFPPDLHSWLITDRYCQLKSQVIYQVCP